MQLEAKQRALRCDLISPGRTQGGADWTALAEDGGHHVLHRDRSRVQEERLFLTHHVGVLHDGGEAVARTR